MSVFTDAVSRRAARGARGSLAVLALGALALTGCASGTTGSEATDAAKTEAPQTPAPAAIAALDYESAEVLAELGLADRVVLAPESATKAPLGGHVEDYADIKATFPVAAKLDPETIIAAGPELAVMSPRHGAEDTMGGVLENAGVKTLELPTSWTSPESVEANITLIGEATGTETEAKELNERLEKGLEKAGAPAAATADSPNVLVLSNQAGRPFATAGEAYPLELLKLAGATSASDTLGMRATGPITAEQIIVAAPDGIVLVDMNGSGDRLFKELLATPAVAALPAAASDKLMHMTGREVQALGLTDTIAGLEKLTGWVGDLK